MATPGNPKLETPYRRPDIRISGRRCALCGETPRGAVFALTFHGSLTGNVYLCVKEIIRASYELAASRDAIIKIEVDPGGIILGQN